MMKKEARRIMYVTPVGQQKTGKPKNLKMMRQYYRSSIGTSEEDRREKGVILATADKVDTR